MSRQTSTVQVPDERLQWVEPSLTRHASLTALTQTQYPYDPSMGPLTREQAEAFGIPCSQGFCP